MVCHVEEGGTLVLVDEIEGAKLWYAKLNVGLPAHFGAYVFDDEGRDLEKLTGGFLRI